MPKKKPGEKVERRMAGYRLDIRVLDAISALAETDQRTKNQWVERALWKVVEEEFTKLGWV